MRANQINIYDLDAVTTTIVMREIPANPDVQNIFMYDLDAVNTNIIMHYFGELVSGGGTNWTKTLEDFITLNDSIVKGFGKIISDTVTLNDFLSGGIPGGQLIRTYRWYWIKIYVWHLEGRNVIRIRLFD